MNRRTRPAARIFQLILAILATFFALYPVWFVLLASGRAGQRLLTLNLLGTFIPTEWTFENYQTMLFQQPFLQWIQHSFFVAFMTTISCLLIATSATFAFSRMKF